MTARGAARGRAPLLLTAPALLTAGAVLLPLLYLALRAATASRSAWGVLDATTARLVLDTLLLVGIVVAVAVALGVPLAWLVTRTDLPARRFWTVALALPLVIPSYVAALALLGALGPRGLLQEVLGWAFGVDRLPEIYGLPGSVLALALSTYPYVYLLVAAALRDLDPAFEEAARGLGRSRWQVFRSVTLPALRPSVAAGGLLVGLYVLSDFGVVSLMQYPALTRAIYLSYNALFDREPAVVLGLVLVALTALVLVAESRFRRSARYHRSTATSARRAQVVELGRWRWPALAACGAVVGVFLLLPVSVLVYWTWQAVPLGRPIDVAWQAAFNSALASALAAAVAVAAALPVVYLAHRRPAWWTRLLERACFTANALPGIVVALSLVFFGARYGGIAYQTLALLVFAYVVRFLPQALAASGSALQTVNPRFEEAARGLGRGPVATLATVTAPLVRSGLLAGAALVFLSALKELPATLLLRPIGFDTLATEIWQATAFADFSAAAPSALLLIAISAPYVYLLVGRHGRLAGPSAG
ncbi:MAG TPA: iron ABC transporter permease [Gaiellaceae bacterium]|nr:iron ABC transporter permease [Gaiellaceae bacterium]